MAKKTTQEKAARKKKMARKTGKSPDARTRRPRYTSSNDWKAVGASRWPNVIRPAARMLETEGSLNPQQAAIAGARSAQARLLAMQQAAVVPGPAAGGAPPPIPPAIGANNWTPLGPLAIPNGQTYSASDARVLVSGRVTAIAIDPSTPDTVYLGTAQGGVWKSTDNGVSWEPRTDNEVSLAIGGLALDPNSPQIIYAGTGEGNFSGDSYYGAGILKSVDGGGTWTNLAKEMFVGNRFCRIIVDPTSGTPASRLFAATIKGLYWSINGGVKWTPLTTGLPTNGAATDVAHDAATNTLYVAFWGDWGAGIYKSTNANAASPTFAQLTSGLPSAAAPAPNGITRIALGMSASNPSTVYALMANNDMTPYNPPHDGAPFNYAVDKFYVTTNSGASWSAIPLPLEPKTTVSGLVGIAGQGFYNLAVNVDPTTPDIVYLSATSLWKAVKSGSAWTITDIGDKYHPDNHVLTFRPGNHLVLWAGSDGGAYRSVDGGTTWDDSVNKGLCIMQMEFIDQHPSSTAVVFSGTQDNGTEQYRGTPVFYHADEGDGGYAIVNQSNPSNIVSTYFGASPKLSTQGGKFGTWMPVDKGIGGTDALFYPPMVACKTNARALALGTTVVNFDPAQGTSHWTTQVVLPGLTDGELVSSLSYLNVNLVYAATNAGKVYKLALSGTTWTATVVSQSPLPVANITDLTALTTAPETLVVVMSDFEHGHVWRGVVPAAGLATWTDLSGDLPDIPVNAIVIDPTNANRLFAGTDIGVFETANGGKTWHSISASSTGLPNCAVFDLRLHEATRILRAATHGRGLWEKLIDAPSTPSVDTYVRNHVMDTARVSPTISGLPATFDDPTRYVALGDPQYFWMCADIKIDALEGTVPSYQMPIAAVDYVAFEALQHRQPQRTKVNRVYVQLHNRGFQPASNVTVKILWADASAGLPALPADFWTAFPSNSANTAQWRPVGAAKTIALFKPGKPVVLEWDWTPPPGAAEHSCLLVVMDSASDPIPAARKVFDVGVLIPTEKRIGLKNLHIVDTQSSPAIGETFATLRFAAADKGTIQLAPHSRAAASVSLIFSKKAIAADAKLTGLKASAPPPALLHALTAKYGQTEIAGYELTRAYSLAAVGKTGSLTPAPGDPDSSAIVAIAGAVKGDGGAAFSIIQLEGDRIIGGSTFALKKV
jgi:photosystem II stability/assembly factor-like uncharacterized protein